MRLVERAARTFLLGIALVAFLPTAASQGRSAPDALIHIVSPPPGISAPVGQALEVRYRVLGTAARSELWSDGELIFAGPVWSGQEVARAWTPAEAALHSLTVCVFDQEGVPLVAIERIVVGLPPGSPARISSAAEGTFNATHAVPAAEPRCATRGGAP